jgi:hypothetical protein
VISARGKIVNDTLVCALQLSGIRIDAHTPDAVTLGYVEPAFV